MESPYMTPNEVAAYLRVDPQTVRRWCTEGALTPVRAGRQLRIHRDELARFTGHRSEQPA